MSNEQEMSRREFLSADARTSAGLAAWSGITFIAHPERVFGANDRVQVAIIGLHGQGFSHVEEYSKIKTAAIVVLCDVDENVLNQRLGQMEKMGLPKPTTCVHLRKLPADKAAGA